MRQLCNVISFDYLTKKLPLPFADAEGGCSDQLFSTLGLSAEWGTWKSPVHGLGINMGKNLKYH